MIKQNKAMKDGQEQHEWIAWGEKHQWISCCNKHSITKETVKEIHFPEKHGLKNILLRRKREIVFPNIY